MVGGHIYKLNYQISMAQGVVFSFRIKNCIAEVFWDQNVVHPELELSSSNK